MMEQKLNHIEDLDYSLVTWYDITECFDDHATSAVIRHLLILKNFLAYNSMRVLMRVCFFLPAVRLSDAELQCYSWQGAALLR